MLCWIIKKSCLPCNLKGSKIDENRGRNRVCSDFSARTRNNVSLFCLKTDREIDVINLGCRGPCRSKGYIRLRKDVILHSTQKRAINGKYYFVVFLQPVAIFSSIIFQWISIFSLSLISIDIHLKYIFFLFFSIFMEKNRFFSINSTAIFSIQEND